MSRTYEDEQGDELQPLLERALQLLESSPRGVSRRDILSALNLQPAAWGGLRAALEDCGEVVRVGRGPGLKHVHRRWIEEHQEALAAIRVRTNGRDGARRALRALLEERGEIDSRDAQKATGLDAEGARRLLHELIRAGRVTRVGQKRSTRYRWEG